MESDSLDSAAAISWARDELLERLRLRDRLLLAYLALAGVAGGWAVVKGGEPKVLLVLPLVALAIELIRAQHYQHIGLLACFCATHDGAIPSRQPNEEWAAPVLFDQWIALGSQALRATLLRALGTALVILLPPLAALLWNWEYRTLEPQRGDDSLRMVLLWWAGVVSFLAAASVSVLAYLHRRRLFIRTRDFLKDKNVKRGIDV